MTDPVRVTITLADASPKLGDFGTIGIFASCPYAGDPETFECSPTGLAAMLEAGFATGDEAYKMVSALAAQENGQSSCKIYPRDSGANAQEYTLTPLNVTVGVKYTLGVKGPSGASVDASYIVESGDDASDIVDALLAQLEAQTPATVHVIGNSDGLYRVRIGATNYDYTAATDTVDEIGAALAAVIDADADLVATYDAGTDMISILNRSGQAVTVTSVTSPSADLEIDADGEGPEVGLYVAAANDAGTLVLTPAVTGQRFWLDEWCRHLDVSDTSTAEDLDDDLAAALETDPDFYGFLIDSTCPGEIEMARSFAITNHKMFVAMVIESDIGGNGDEDLGSETLALNGMYAKLWYHKRTSERPDCALMGKVFGNGPAFGWEFLTLEGVSAPRLLAGFAANLDDKLVGYYGVERDVSYTKTTKFPGRYPDLTRGFDWYSDRLSAALFKVFKDAAPTGGISFTDQDAGKFVSAASTEAVVAVGQKLLARDPAPVTTIIPVSEVSSLDKSARNFPDGGLRQTATIAGKIESMPIEVVVTP